MSLPETGGFRWSMNEHSSRLETALRYSVTCSFTHTVPTDYYVYCFSDLFDFRLFDDFEGDACLVINNPKQFTDRLLCAGFQKFPDWLAQVDTVDYLDPLRTKPGTIRPFFSKHFRYSYQTELRIVWLPQNPQAK